MKNYKYYLLSCFFFFGLNKNLAQINLSDRLLNAATNGLKALTFTNEDAAALSLQAIIKLDAENPVAKAKDPYHVRLAKLVAKHLAEDGLKLNFKVYKVKDINAFATADGSVRVFEGLMDIMDDNELLAVIGHEIGHVVNQDSKDAMRAALGKEALFDGAASQSGKIAALTDSQLGQIGREILNNNHSRSQETAADVYAYSFMRKHAYNVNAIESALNLIAKSTNSDNSNTISTLFSSHPDASQRAMIAKEQAIVDGLYKPYIKNAKQTTKKAAVIKPKRKK